ncbi:MAG: hypothetical protein GY724_20565 [Actinomycetia bacterium]|nr:hypothetical protein [Actinomycetes bacterium]
MKGTAGTTYQLGLVTAVMAAAMLHASVLAPETYDLLDSSRFGWWLVVAGVLMAASYGLGLPELPSRRREAVLRAMAAAVAAVLVVSAFQLVLAAPLLPRSSLGLVVLITPIWAVIGWNLARDVAHWQTQRDQVFLVAEQIDERASLRFELSHRPESPAVVVGSMQVDDARLGADGQARLVEEATRSGASVIVLDTAAQSDDGIVQQAAILHGQGLRIRTLALFYEGWLGKLPVAELARVSLLFDIGAVHRQHYVRAKRVIDITIALICSMGLVVVAPIVAFVNLVANRGPLLFAQPRVGRDGEVFTIYKFRTMIPTERDGAPTPWTAVDDPRVTPFGMILRRSHLDELPQVVNILKGELSFVGPRPEQPHYVEGLKEKIAFFDVRHLVRPGLTGWAQVKQGYAADEADALEKLQYDFFYLRRQGLALDLRIIWRTVRGVVAGRGR